MRYHVNDLKSKATAGWF